MPLRADALTIIYKDALHLVNENKVSTKNAFSIELIENMEDILAEFDREQAGDDVNFHRAARTLDASARVYGYRVDNVYCHADKVRGGLMASLEDDDKLARKVLRFDEHLLPDGALSSAHGVSGGHWDPFFSQVTKKIENGGDQALMLNLFPSGPSGSVVFDGLLPVWSSAPACAVRDLDHALPGLRAKVVRVVGPWCDIDSLLPEIDSALPPAPADEPEVAPEPVVVFRPSDEPVAPAELAPAEPVEVTYCSSDEAPEAVPAGEAAALAPPEEALLEDDFQFVEPKPKKRKTQEKKAKRGRPKKGNWLDTPPPKKKRDRSLQTPAKLDPGDTPAKVKLENLLDAEDAGEGAGVAAEDAAWDVGMESDEAPVQHSPQATIDALLQRVSHVRASSLRMPACVEKLRGAVAAGRSFASASASVRGTFAADEDREAFSTPIAFICALHMATQHSFALVRGEGDGLGDFEIVPDLGHAGSS